MYHIIVNPASKSGKGAKYFKLLEQYLNNNQVPYTVSFSKRIGHVTELVRDLTKNLDNSSNSISIIIVGGDGTLNESLQGICNFDKVRLSYIPTGSGNDFARDLQLPKDPVENLKHILKNPQETLIDLGKVSYQVAEGHSESRYFVVSCGLGFDAAVCEAVYHSPFKKVLNRIGLGKTIYLLKALQLLIKNEPTKGTLTLEDSKKTLLFDDIFLAAGMNHKFEGGGFMFAPHANNSDGYLDICLANNISKWKVLQVLPKAFHGNHTKYKEIYSQQCSCYTLHTETALCLQTDGEIPAYTDSLTVSCVPKLLHFYN